MVLPACWWMRDSPLPKGATPSRVTHYCAHPTRQATWQWYLTKLSLLPRDQSPRTVFELQVTQAHRTYRLLFRGGTQGDRQLSPLVWVRQTPQEDREGSDLWARQALMTQAGFPVVCQPPRLPQESRQTPRGHRRPHRRRLSAVPLGRP